MGLNSSVSSSSIEGAGAAGFEPTSGLLESLILPLDDTPSPSFVVT